jgi:hypothetical protein
MRSLLSLRHLVVVVGITLGLMPQARAGNVRITMNGTVASADPGMGYTVGDPVSFFWVVNDFAPQTPFGSVVPGLRMSWDYNGPANPQLFASAGGTGLAGTFEPGSYSFFMTYPTGEFEIEYDGTATGLYLAANPSTPLTYNFAEVVLAAPGFSGFPLEGTLPNPATYLADYFGTYSITSFDSFELKAGALKAEFTPTSFTIAAEPAPVPEIDQAGIAGVAALLACGFGLLERRRRSALARA